MNAVAYEDKHSSGAVTTMVVAVLVRQAVVLSMPVHTTATPAVRMPAGVVPTAAMQLRGSHFGVATDLPGKRDRHRTTNSPQRFMPTGAAHPASASGPTSTVRPNSAGRLICAAAPICATGPIRIACAVGAIRVGTANYSGSVAVVVSERVRYAVRHNVARSRIFMLVRVRMPPQHELLNDEEHAKSNDHRDPNRVRAAGSNRFHCLGQQPQQGGTDQSACGEAHEVRQHPQPSLLRKQQKEPREGGARNTADRGEHDYPAEKGHGRSAFVTPSLTF
jgi:hypothetical protein